MIMLAQDSDVKAVPCCTARLVNLYFVCTDHAEAISDVIFHIVTNAVITLYRDLYRAVR